MSPPTLSTVRLVASVLALGLPLLLGSCSSSSPKIKGVPAKLPIIDLHGSSSTPSHSMSRSEYPFDSGGDYVTAWAAEGESKAGRGAATSSDHSGWKSSHHDGNARTTLSKPTKVASGTSSKSKGTGSSSKKSSGSRKHTVRKGDTLSGIARKYGTSVSKLKAANGLKSDMIRDGRTLTIPR